MSSLLSFLSDRRRRRPPLSGAFFAPSDLSGLPLIQSLAALAAAVLDSAAAGDSLRFQRRNLRLLVGKLENLSIVFDFLKESMQSSPFRARISQTATICFRELYILMYRFKILMDYCSQSSRIWLLIKNTQISGYFHDLVLELATLFDVLPFNELYLSSDVLELVELVVKRCRGSKFYVEASVEQLRWKLYSFLQGLERGEVPDRFELHDVFVDGLGIGDVESFRSEIEFLEEQIVSQEDEVHLPVVGGCVALARYCRFFLFGFEERCFDRGINFDGDVSKKLRRKLSSLCSGDFSITVPKDFCCPISLELMKDPVVVSTGQTYERTSITQWIEEGHRTCPNSGQNLTNSRLLPNRVLRNLISQWCAANEIPYDGPDSSVASVDNISIACSSKAAIEANRTLARLLIRELADGSENAKTIAACELRLLAKTGKENRTIIAELGAIPPLCNLFTSLDWIAQENAVTAILNLSIHDNNKYRIMEEEGCLAQIVYVLRYGLTIEAKENAAATLFSLSAIHDYKIRIVNEQGAVASLANLLMEGTTRGKKDAVMALFNLSTHPESWSYMLDFGAVSALVSALRNESIAEEAGGALALLVKQPMVAEMIGNEDTALTNLVGVMRRGTPKGKENAVAALQEMCRRGGLLVTQRVAKMPALHSLIQSILFTGTKRARRKAALLAKMCHRSEPTSSTATTVTATREWVIDPTITSGSMSSSFRSGEVVSVPMVHVL